MLHSPARRLPQNMFHVGHLLYRKFDAAVQGRQRRLPAFHRFRQGQVEAPTVREGRMAMLFAVAGKADTYREVRLSQGQVLQRTGMAGAGIALAATMAVWAALMLGMGGAPCLTEPNEISTPVHGSRWSAWMMFRHLVQSDPRFHGRAEVPLSGAPDSVEDLGEGCFRVSCALRVQPDGQPLHKVLVVCMLRHADSGWCLETMSVSNQD